MALQFKPTRNLLTGLAAFVGALLAPAIWAPHVLAQQEVTLTSRQSTAIEWASERGKLLYRYDQAAWHGTDAFLAQFDTERDQDGMRGYVVIEGEAGQLDTIFFGNFGSGMVEVARYAIDGSEVVASTYHDPADRPSLSPSASRIAAVRQLAIEALVEKELGLCAEAPPNTVALPPDENGIIEVYLLTPPVSNMSYPLGDHYRLTIDTNDEVVEWRQFLNSCFELSSEGQRDEAGDPITPSMVFVTHLLDPEPTEIHFFATRNFPLTVMVATVENELIWTISDGRFEGAFVIEDK